MKKNSIIKYLIWIFFTAPAIYSAITFFFNSYSGLDKLYQMIPILLFYTIYIALTFLIVYKSKINYYSISWLLYTGALFYYFYLKYMSYININNSNMTSIDTLGLVSAPLYFILWIIYIISHIISYRKNLKQNS